MVKLNKPEIIPYILGGNSTFTLRNPRSGTQFTFKVIRPKDCQVHFVKVLISRNNEFDYNYIGFIRGERFIYGKGKSRLNMDSPPVSAFGWLMNNINDLAHIEVLPSGKCCRCGRILKNSSSRHIGPECAKKILVKFKREIK